MLLGKIDNLEIDFVAENSDGLVYYPPLYYLLEKPEITKINDKPTVEFFREELYTVHDTIDRDRQAVPLILPLVEQLVEHSIEIYGEQIAKEFEMFKIKNRLTDDLPSFEVCYFCIYRHCEL